MRSSYTRRFPPISRRFKHIPSPVGAAITGKFDDPFVVDEMDDVNLESLWQRNALTPKQQDEEQKLLAEVQQQRSKRMQVLYDVTHPKPEHYTFNGLLVPPPPYAFGELTSESTRVAFEMLMRPNFRLVSQSDMTSYHFEIHDLYLEIAFVGRANCGKSSLLNAILCQPGMCRSTATPNPNRTINYYQSVNAKQLIRFQVKNSNNLVNLPGGGLQFTFVDLPGWGIDGMKSTWTEEAIQCNQCYLGTRRSLNTVFYCKDATSPWNHTDEKYFDMIHQSHGMCFVVLTKCDKVNHFDLCNMMHKFYCMLTTKKNRHRAYPLIIPTSSALEGGNHSSIYFLRRLIVETSGVIHGTKLRQQAMCEHAYRLHASLVAERDRRIKYLNDFKHPKKLAMSLDSSVLPAGSHTDETMFQYVIRRRKESPKSLGQSFFCLTDGQKNFVYGKTSNAKMTMGTNPERVGPQSQHTVSGRTVDNIFSPVRVNCGLPMSSQKNVNFKTKVGSDSVQGSFADKCGSQHHRSKKNESSLAVKTSYQIGAIVEKNPDRSTNGIFRSGKHIHVGVNYSKNATEKEYLEQPKRTDQLSQSRIEHHAYNKFAGRTFDGILWDRYVESQRSPAYSAVHLTQLPRGFTNCPKRKKTQEQINYEESKLSHKAQPPGLARNYGCNTLTKQYSRVIGV